MSLHYANHNTFSDMVMRCNLQHFLLSLHCHYTSCSFSTHHWCHCWQRFYGPLCSSISPLQITISRRKKLSYATEPVPILWQRGTQSYNLLSQVSGAATASTNLFWPATAWGSEEIKKQIILMLSHAQGLIRTGYHLSALSLWTSVNGRSELTGEYFLINYTISSESTQVNTRALVDTGNSDYTFID